MAKSVSKKQNRASLNEPKAANIKAMRLLSLAVEQKGKENTRTNREGAAEKVMEDLQKIFFKHNLTGGAKSFEIKLGALTISGESLSCPPGCKKCKQRCKEIVDENGKVIGMKCKTICIDH